MSTLYSSVTHLDSIYEAGGYQYSFPRSDLEKMIQGLAFGNTTPYNEEKIRIVLQETQVLYEQMMGMRGHTLDFGRPVARFSAGAPLAGKSTLFEENLKSESESRGYQIPYICPDRIALPALSTYRSDIETSGSVVAYERNRAASNTMTHFILAALIKQKASFYFGTTSSSPFTYKMYEHVIKEGFDIVVDYVSASNETRYRSLVERNKSVVQESAEDVELKGRMIHERIEDTFLKYATVINFYYRPAYNEKALLGAIWKKGESDVLGTLEIVDEVAYGELKRIHNESVLATSKTHLIFENTLESRRFTHSYATSFLEVGELTPPSNHFSVGRGLRFPYPFYEGILPTNWESDLSSYRPIFFESEELDRQPSWAHPKKFTPVLLDSMRSYYPIRLGDDGLPRNPVGPTGILGRGELGKFGPNHAADPVITRINHETNKLEIALVLRSDGAWALPGGMITFGESFKTAALREFFEEALGGGKKCGDAQTKQTAKEEANTIFEELLTLPSMTIYKGYCNDLRNTDHAWLETIAVSCHLPQHLGNTIELMSDGDETYSAGWVSLDSPILHILFASHGEIILNTVKDYLKQGIFRDNFEIMSQMSSFIAQKEIVKL